MLEKLYFAAIVITGSFILALVYWVALLEAANV